MPTYQISDLNPEVIEKFQTNNYRLPHWKKTTVCPLKFPEIRPGIFGRMVSAHGLGRAYRKAMFFARSSLPKRNLDLTSFSLKYWSKCALKILKRHGLARLASARRTNSNGSIILFSQIYPLNSDLLLPRKV